MGLDNYNGWANRETWLIGLWIDNEEGTHLASREAFRGWVSEGKKGHQLGDALREWVEETLVGSVLEELLGASFLSDLVGGAFSRVEWREVTDHWVDELKEVAR